MTEFREQDLSGTRFEHVSLRGAEFNEVLLNGADMRNVDFSGARVRGSLFNDVRMRGVELIDVQISGELQNVVVNGVDIAPLVEAELNRRTPERAKMRPEDADGFREAWAILERLWDGTVARARKLPEEALHRTVDDEWSFIQTLRHLNFATAAWVGQILGEASPWHPLDLPWDEAPGWDGIPWDREARPTLEEVLAVRRERQAMVRQVLASLTEEQLASEVTCTDTGWPLLEGFPFKECLKIVVNEEWEHRLYAERDLTALTKENTTMDMLLIGGLWLDGSAWDQVVAELEPLGHRPVPITLPGQGDGSTSATLDDQLAAVVAAVDAAAGKPLVVGHSGACTLAWLAADARPERVAKVALIGGFPSADGEKYAEFFDIKDGAMPFPGWGPFSGPDSADLDEQTKQSIAAAAIPVPEAVATGVVRLTDERRFDIPVVAVCPEYSPAQAKEWIDGGEVPELAKATKLEYVDIDSGHWPMFSKPAELARILAGLADGA